MIHTPCDGASLETMKHSLLAVLGISLLSGCALLKESESHEKEKLLIASGFQARPATTVQQQASLAAMPPYRIRSKNVNGTFRYFYAAPDQKTVYIGGPQQYSAYQKLAAQQNIAEENEASSAAEQMSMDEMSYWGPWEFGGVPMPGTMTQW